MVIFVLTGALVGAGVWIAVRMEGGLGTAGRPAPDSAHPAVPAAGYGQHLPGAALEVPHGRAQSESAA